MNTSPCPECSEYRRRLDAISFALPYWMGFTEEQDRIAALIAWIKAHRSPYSVGSIEDSWRFQAERANKLEAENLKLQQRVRELEGRIANALL